MFRKYILIMIFAIASILLLSDQLVVVRVHSNAPANGFVSVLDQYSNYIVGTGWDGAEFLVGYNSFPFYIPDSYDLSLIYGDAGGGTAWGDWLEIFEQGFTGNPPTCNILFQFSFPQNMSVFIYTNSDVEEGTVELYGPLLVESITKKWDNDDYDHNGVTEVHFEDIFLEGGGYQNVTVVAYGTNVYGEELSLESDEGFVWNAGEEQWENYELSYTNTGFNYPLPEVEERTFHRGWNWASTPRLFRVGNDGFDAEIVIDDLEPHALWIEAQEPDDNYMEFIDDPGYWHHHGDLDDFISTSGYKLNMSNDYYSYDLDVYGTVLDPETNMSLIGGGYENWIGYYLPYSLRPSEAFAQIWDNNLYQIKAENWTMYKHGGVWQGSNMRYTLNYGEMYIVKCVAPCTFQWDNDTGGVEPNNRDKSEHFTYDEEADYIPIFAEFEEGDEPLEIGVIVAGECKGAAKVEDSSVQINAYILEGQGEDVEFEMYYGRSKPEMTQKNYTVYNPVTNLHENRKIKTGEYRDFYMISFNKEADEQIDNETLQVYYSPNPFYSSTVISFNLKKEKDITLEIYNIKGQRIKTLYKGNSTAGEHNVTWNGTDENNKKVSTGIYFYKLITPEKILSKKMLLMR